ncbi:AgrD family cyclic lactone autoinducer peptide [Paenibacillus abyssi]|uniref:Cyclic lactone autoinducer peptide n=1 Tax=Paenibacillus abyssi TaxID=1340531 RepID=A0A917G3M6_9BACL|nr:cyclic lactone autoinducer peptide [Paenibacillus abyssi]GGG20859.1 hypothetical protein GCM10010916_41980 [Paenibacillus abyssi]
MRKKFYTLLATALAGAAVLVVSTASWAYINQPETPKELL